MPHDHDHLFELLLASSSRRDFLRRAGVAGIGLTGAGTFLAACGGIDGSANENGPAPAAVKHPAGPIGELTVSNWPLYIDKKVNKAFVKKLDVGEFKYIEEINDNEEFFGKVRQPLSQGDSIGRDIVVLTDWMAARMVNLGYLEPLDKDNIPNASNLQPSLAEPAVGPQARVLAAVAVGHDGDRVQPRRRPGARSPPSRTCSTRSSRAAYRCSRTAATPPT